MILTEPERDTAHTGHNGGSWWGAFKVPETSQMNHLWLRLQVSAAQLKLFYATQEICPYRNRSQQNATVDQPIGTEGAAQRATHRAVLEGRSKFGATTVPCHFEDASSSFVLPNKMAALHVPDHTQLVPGASSKVTPIGGEGDRVDRLCVVLQGVEALSRLWIPQTDSGVEGGPTRTVRGRLRLGNKS